MNKQIEVKSVSKTLEEIHQLSVKITEKEGEVTDLKCKREEVFDKGIADKCDEKFKVPRYDSSDTITKCELLEGGDGHCMSQCCPLVD